MRAAALGASIIATIAVGLWATMVAMWIHAYDPAQFHE